MMTSPSTMPAVKDVKVLVSQIALMTGALKGRKGMRIGATGASITETVSPLACEDTDVEASTVPRSQFIDLIAVARMM